LGEIEMNKEPSTLTSLISLDTDYDHLAYTTLLLQSDDGMNIYKYPVKAVIRYVGQGEWKPIYVQLLEEEDEIDSDRLELFGDCHIRTMFAADYLTADWFKPNYQWDRFDIMWDIEVIETLKERQEKLL
jgi:hypothetical protein